MLPASGAWRPGDHPGQRRFLSLATRPAVRARRRRLAARHHDRLRDLGRARRRRRQRRARVPRPHRRQPRRRPARRRPPAAGWWDGLIGPGKALDTDRYFVVCANVLGGCQGTTGPASPHPDDGRPYASRFPVVSIRDWVRTQAALADHLGIDRWLTAVGGSMGGMMVLEWAIMFPDRVRSIVPIATCVAATAQQIGWWSTGRRVIHLDPRFRGGDYYDAAPGDGPHEGLALARMISQITFRSDDVFTDRFGREVVEPLERRVLAVAAVRGRALPRVPRRQARAPLRRQHLPARHEGDGPARHRSRPRRHRTRRCDGSRRRCSPSASARDILYPAYQSREIVDGVVARRRRRRVRRARQPARPRRVPPRVRPGRRRADRVPRREWRRMADDAHPEWRSETRAVRAGRTLQRRLARAGAVAVDDVLQPVGRRGVRARPSPRTPRKFYSRNGSPTVLEFEDAVAALEGAEAALAFASGMGAISLGAADVLLEPATTSSRSRPRSRSPTRCSRCCARASASTSRSSTPPTATRCAPRCVRARRSWCSSRRPPTRA